MIEIVEYQARWPGEYRSLESELKEILGPHAVRVDHIGSTAVPRLAAKDILDVMVSVPALAVVNRFRPALEDAGFVYRPHVTADHVPAGQKSRDLEWEKRLFNRYAPWRRVHLHIRVAGRANQRFALLFRDYLRSHVQVAAAYEAVKRQLAGYFGGLEDHTPYVEIKDPVCDLIMAAAEEWAAQNDWTVNGN